MPDIKFFEQARLRSGYEEYAAFDSTHSSKSIKLGEYRFYRTKTARVCGIVAGGMYDLLGYEMTYSNPFISQEETDRLMQKYREETGQVL